MSIPPPNFPAGSASPPTELGALLYQGVEPMAWADQENQLALWRYCLALAFGHEMAAYISDGNDVHPDAPAWTTALHPDHAPEELLPWVAQFVGVRWERPNLYVLRPLIKDRPRQRRGTPAYILEVMRRYLDPADTPYVRLIERAGGEAYRLEVFCKLDEVVNLPAMEAALTLAVPAGFNTDINDWSQMIWQEVREVGTWQDVKDAYATWGDLIS